MVIYAHVKTSAGNKMSQVRSLLLVEGRKLHPVFSDSFTNVVKI